jgi:VWFA-related protein
MRAARFLLFWAFVANAQNPPADYLDPYSAPRLTFNLVAVDAKGAPLRELRAADLRIYDDGRLMQAAFCRPLVTAERQLVPLGPREYSNRPSGAKSQSTLVLLDLLNANLAERSLGWNDIVRTFQKLESGEHLYVYLLTNQGTFYPIHPLPDAESPISPDDTDWVAQLPSLLDQAMRKVSQLRAREYQLNVDSRIHRTLAVLGDLASHFGAQPGRKSLVWISHGVPIGATGTDGQWRDYTPFVTHLGADLARSGIMVYAVDQEERTTSGMSSADTLQQIAGLTAGKWLLGDTRKAIEQAVSEGPAAYQVGYIPLPERWDNKFHKLRVTTENKGARLRAIDGYYGDVGEADPRQRLELAALGQSDDSEIGIRAAVTSSEQVNGWTHFQVRVDAADLQLTTGETYTGEISVTMAYYTTEWRPDAAKGIRTKLRLTPGEHDTIMRDGVNVSFDRQVPTGVHKVRIVICDNHSWAIGSLTVPLASP